MFDYVVHILFDYENLPVYVEDGKWALKDFIDNIKDIDLIDLPTPPIYWF